MISVNNLSYGYSKKNILFQDFTFNQREVSVVGLFGRNGAGKSTLLKLLSGLIKPNKGTIEVNGFVPFNRDPNFLADIYLVPETPFFPQVSIKKYIKVYASFYGKFDFEKMNHILHDFNLAENNILSNLSLGQQKKFIVAFALSTNCSVLLFDEPTNGFDIPSKSIFRKVMINSIEDNQLVVISTHQVKDIDTIIDKIIVLESGNIIFEERASEITQKFQFKNVSNLDDKNILYSEKGIGGYKAILPLKDYDETDIDIELLFNAIINKTNIKL